MRARAKGCKGSPWGHFSFAVCEEKGSVHAWNGVYAGNLRSYHSIGLSRARNEPGPGLVPYLWGRSAAVVHALPHPVRYFGCPIWGLWFSYLGSLSYSYRIHGWKGETFHLWLT